MDSKVVDHLFRHQYGKMIAVLTSFFGLAHLELIEDAVQDTFVKATLQWRNNIPENPEAWFIKAAKNRTIDLLRKIKAEHIRSEKLAHGAASIQLNELFLEHEIEDSQLRMIFVACHPELAPEEQIAFALKTISGFSMKEIAAALLLKEETIKKRLVRARKKIVQKSIDFEFPDAKALNLRLSKVLQVVYLIFNEGFHSAKREPLVDTHLCGESLRLCQLLLKKPMLRNGNSYALFALLCFHAARIESKVSSQQEIIDLEHQDRNLWHIPLIKMGNQAMMAAVSYPEKSSYTLEAAIAAEHLKAKDFKSTNWGQVLAYYTQLQAIYPSNYNLLNMAIVHLQLGEFEQAKQLLDAIPPAKLGQREYLLHGSFADYHFKTGNSNAAIAALDQAIALSTNNSEKKYLQQKRILYTLNTK